uniref:Uncharacterized protein n=1 Tax=Daphnia galeata TaxID=27404 RepID=A0A8J2RIQ3_9CRUS|nr:unnamed protein product [Daphnia galeata]
MEGYMKMHSAPVSPTSTLKSTFLLTCSIINILVLPICSVRLSFLQKTEIDGIFDLPEIKIALIPFMLTGLLGFSTSYTMKRPMCDYYDSGVFVHFHFCRYLF